MAIARPFLMFQGGSAQAALDLYFSTFPRIPEWCGLSTGLKASLVLLAP